MPVLGTARIDFTSGSSGGAAAIVSNPAGMTSPSQITEKSIHTVCLDTAVSLGYFLNGVEYRPAGTFTYFRPCSRNGSTAYDIPVASTGEVTASEFLTSGGGFIAFENFANTSSQTLPEYYAISAR